MLSGGQAPGAPILAAGDGRSVGRVSGLALVAHRRGDRGNADLAVATIKVRDLGLGLGRGVSICWHCNLSLRGDCLGLRGATVDGGENSKNNLGCRDVRRVLVRGITVDCQM